MNDLEKRKERILKGYYRPGEIPEGIDKLTTGQLFYKKLGAYLLLLYQAYLKKETVLEPATRLAIWRLIQFDKAFLTKITVLQLDELNVKPVVLALEWEQAKDVLFPIEQQQLNLPMNNKREDVINEYKEVVAELLAAAP